MIAIAGYINYTGSLSDIISVKDKESIETSNDNISSNAVGDETYDISMDITSMIIPISNNINILSLPILFKKFKDRFIFSSNTH
mgnify:CR=1 FL=1